tara:strand:+ start:63815 stop:64825 length:1011 start_codon:yes stop_codon:yes gene_type:complete
VIPETPRPLRLAVIGARRVRNGTGPFLALQAVEAGLQVEGGIDVNAIWGTRPETAEDARQWLAGKGLECDAFSDWDELVAAAAPDALIIASPVGTHRDWLAMALDAGIHVFCEKPLLASSISCPEAMCPVLERTAKEDHSDASRLAHAYSAMGLLLRETCQWPVVMNDFSRLHPEINLASVTRFLMRMTPAGEGIERWIEMLSHPISLIQAICPGPMELSGIQYIHDRVLEFQVVTANRTLDCAVELVDQDVWPRPAEFSLDGALIRREIEQPGYKFFFSDGDGNRIHGEDPMPRAVLNFLNELKKVKQSGSAPVDENLIRRQAILAELLEARPQG